MVHGIRIRRDKYPRWLAMIQLIFYPLPRSGNIFYSRHIFKGTHHAHHLPNVYRRIYAAYSSILAHTEIKVFCNSKRIEILIRRNDIWIYRYIRIYMYIYTRNNILDREFPLRKKEVKLSMSWNDVVVVVVRRCLSFIVEPRLYRGNILPGKWKSYCFPFYLRRVPSWPVRTSSNQTKNLRDWLGKRTLLFLAPRNTYYPSKNTGYF